MTTQFFIGVALGAAIMLPRCWSLLNDTEKWYKQGKHEGKQFVMDKLLIARYKSKRVGELWRVGIALDKLERELHEKN